jgi:hypothetical protein
MDEVGVPLQLQQWYKNNLENNPSWDRKNVHVGVGLLKDAIDSSSIEPQLKYHLLKSVFLPKK